MLFVDFRQTNYKVKIVYLFPVLLPFSPKGEVNRRYNTMKEVNKGILDNDMVISAENIQKIGEVIALTCIKTVIVRSGKDLHYL